MSDELPDAPVQVAPVKEKKMRLTRQDRRRLLRTALLAGGVLGAALSGFLPLVYAQKQRLRPPGALDEKDFLGSCIKCGQCVQACPYQSVKLIKTTEPGLAGTPTVVPREAPCDPAAGCLVSSNAILARLSRTRLQALAPELTMTF